MKKYVEIEVKYITLSAQDVITASGFAGEDDLLPNPNKTTEVAGLF